MRANSVGRNHSTRIFRVETKSMATPAPTRALPAMAQRIVGASPRRTAPAAARRKKTEIVRRGPQESARSPAGSCMAA